MSTSPLTKVSSSAFINGGAFKRKTNGNSQIQTLIVQNSPLKSTEENENSPSKIINIYSDSVLFNNVYCDEKQNNSYKTYNKMQNEEAERVYQERQKMIKDHVKRTKLNGKVQQKNQKQKTLKSALKKSQLDNSTSQSQQIDISRTSHNFRKRSIDQPIINAPKPYPKYEQSFHQDLLTKKQQLLNDIVKLEQEIIQEKNKKQINIIQQKSQKSQKQLNNSMNSSPRTRILQNDRIYEKRQQQKKQQDQDKIKKEMEQCTFKPQISATSRTNQSRKLNTSQSSKITPQISPKQANRQIKPPTRSQSQTEIDVLQHSREELNNQLSRINEKYNFILEQSTKLRNKLI